MKRFLFLLVIVLMIFENVSAEEFEENLNVAVMNLGIYQGTSDPDLNLINAEKTSDEYIIQRLVMSGKFDVIDKNIVTEKLKDLKLDGIISANTAKKVGEILGVDYVIYGNVTGLSVNDDVEYVVNTNTIKASIIIRIMNVESGRILMAAKGVGKSQSGFVHLEGENPITIGTVEVTQDSVHNALKKAAEQSVDILIERLFNKKGDLK